MLRTVGQDNQAGKKDVYVLKTLKTLKMLERYSHVLRSIGVK